MVHQEQTDVVGLMLNDARMHVLVDQIQIWTLVDTKFEADLGVHQDDVIGQTAAELLEEMAEAGAFSSHRDPVSFFLPEPSDAMRYLVGRGLVVPGRRQNEFLISERGSGSFHARQTVSSPVSLEDFQQTPG